MADIREMFDKPEQHFDRMFHRTQPYEMRNLYFDTDGTHAGNKGMAIALSLVAVVWLIGLAVVCR